MQTERVKGCNLKVNDVVCFWFCPTGGILKNKTKYTGKFDFHDIYEVHYRKGLEYKTASIAISHNDYYDLVIE